MMCVGLFARTWIFLPATMRILFVLVPLTVLGSLTRKSQGSLESSNKEEQNALLVYSSVDVSLLSHSLLQLGFGLKEQVDRTKQQMAGIFQQLELFNSSLAELLQQVSTCERTWNSLTRRAKELENKDEELQRLSTELHHQLSEVVKHELSLNSKIDSLEQRTVTSLSSKAGGHLMSLLVTQSMKIDELFTEVGIQHSKMNAQEGRIKHLGKKVGSRRRKLGSQRPKLTGRKHLHL